LVSRLLPPADPSAVKFGYGGRTLTRTQGLDEAEGRVIVGRLLRALPAKAGGVS
jgi:hypothetical protein